MNWRGCRGIWWPTEGRWWVLKARRLPFAPWDVYREHTVGKENRFERFAGGFWTLRAAKRWVENEHSSEQRLLRAEGQAQ